MFSYYNIFQTVKSLNETFARDYSNVQFGFVLLLVSSSSSIIIVQIVTLNTFEMTLNFALL